MKKLSIFLSFSDLIGESSVFIEVLSNFKYIVALK